MLLYPHCVDRPARPAPAHPILLQEKGPEHKDSVIEIASMARRITTMLLCPILPFCGSLFVALISVLTVIAYVVHARLFPGISRLLSSVSRTLLHLRCTLVPGLGLGWFAPVQPRNDRVQRQLFGYLGRAVLL